MEPIPELKPSEEGTMEILSDERANIILDEIEREETKYDNDLLIKLIKTISRIEDKFQTIKKWEEREERIKQYIQFALDIMFHELKEKYRYSWVENTYFTPSLTAPVEVLNFFESPEFQKWLELIRNFKEEFTTTFQEQLGEIEGTIEEPGTIDTVLADVNKGGNIQPETRSKFLKYYQDSTKERKRLSDQFPDELINALVFQYIFGVYVLGEKFMEFTDQLANEGVNITYPFDMRNPFLFGWAGKATQPSLSSIALKRIKEIPEVITKMQQYKEGVAKNAALCIIKCQFSNWTMMQYNEQMRLRRTSTNYAVDTIRALNDFYDSIYDSDQPMEIEVETEEQEDPDYNQEYVDALMTWCKKKPKDSKKPLEIGYPVLDEKFQEYDTETRTKKKDVIKPATTSTLDVLNRNIAKGIKRLIKQLISDKAIISEIKKHTKTPIKKVSEILEDLNN